MKLTSTLRGFDITISVIGLVFSLPLMILICTIGLLDTGSPLFIQLRVGKHRKCFKLIKFRTMAINTISTATHEVDPNAVTQIGKFLRKTKLDELPQLFNVLCGDMSLVGPRPCLPSQSELIHERERRNVYEVRPGVTGLGQLNNVDMSTPRKLARYDQITIKKLSLLFYFTLILKTALGAGSGDRVQTGKIIS